MFLCLDPEGSTEPAERRRRQQEVENLLERYIERSDDARTDRPVALLLTKFDRVIAGAGAEVVAGPDAEDPPIGRRASPRRWSSAWSTPGTG